MTGREERKTQIENKINKILCGKPKLFSNYVSYCLSSGQQPTTTKSYLLTAIAFMEYIKNEVTIDSVKEIMPLDISNYLNAIRTRTLKDGSVVPTSTSYRATTYSALRNFFDFLVMNKIIAENPVSGMKRPKVTDDVSQEHLSLSEMKSVLDKVRDGSGVVGQSRCRENNMKTRNMAMIRMLLELGIRCSALTCIDVEDIDLENKKIVYKDKGEKTFEKPISNELVDCLKAWLYDRSKLNPKTNALFVSEKRRRCSYGAVLNLVKKFTKSATGSAMSVHKMRHSAITAMYEMNGNDIVHAAKFAGHSNVTTTQRYINTDYSEKDIELAAQLGAAI